MPLPEAIRPFRRSPHLDLWKSVESSATTAARPAVNLTFGQLPDRLNTRPWKSTILGGVGGGVGFGAGAGVGAGVGVGAGAGDGVGDGEGAGAGVGCGVGAGGGGG